MKRLQGRAETDSAFQSSQGSCPNSQPSQFENSQSSSFDLFSQMMMSQQHCLSQPSEASQMAQKYFMKYSKKPSLFQQKEGQSFERHSLIRRKSFQDLQDMNKNRAKEKDERDLICTFISIVKECLDEVKTITTKFNTDMRDCFLEATERQNTVEKKNTELMSECFTKLSKDHQETIASFETVLKKQSIISEKEELIKSLSDELEKCRSAKHDQLKKMIQHELNKTRETTHCIVKELLAEQKKRIHNSEAHMKTDVQNFLEQIVSAVEEKVLNLKEIWKENDKPVMRSCSTQCEDKQHSFCCSYNSQLKADSAITVARSDTSPSTYIVSTVGGCKTSGQGQPFATGNFPVMVSYRNGTYEPMMNKHIMRYPIVNKVHMTSSSMWNAPTTQVTANKASSCFETQNIQPICVSQGTHGSGAYYNEGSFGIESGLDFSSPSVRMRHLSEFSTELGNWGSKGPSPIAAVAPQVHQTALVTTANNEMPAKHRKAKQFPQQMEKEEPRRKSSRLQEKEYGRFSSKNTMLMTSEVSEFSQKEISTPRIRTRSRKSKTSHSNGSPVRSSLEIFSQPTKSTSLSKNNVYEFEDETSPSPQKLSKRPPPYIAKSSSKYHEQHNRSGLSSCNDLGEISHTYQKSSLQSKKAQQCSESWSSSSQSQDCEINIKESQSPDLFIDAIEESQAFLDDNETLDHCVPVSSNIKQRGFCNSPLSMSSKKIPDEYLHQHLQTSNKVNRNSGGKRWLAVFGQTKVDNLLSSLRSSIKHQEKSLKIFPQK